MNEATQDLLTRPLHLDDIFEAAKALEGVVVRTPLLENLDINKHLSGHLLIKAECMQRTGAFKIRSAYNRMRQMSDPELKRGAITYSSGNHAQGLALAAQLLGSSSLIVMPEDTPLQKIQRTKALGANVVTYNRDTESSDDVVARLRAETGRIGVPPSGDVRTHAGAGTAALEILHRSQDLGASLDAVLIPCGGGGLTAAAAFVMNECSPDTQVYAVESELFDDTRRSLSAGKRVSNPVGQRTICDAIMTPTPNQATFKINQQLLADGLKVSDDEVCDAMLFAYEHYKLVIEPWAAVGLAAVLSNKIDIKDKTIAVCVTGGNIAPNRFMELLNIAIQRRGETTLYAN
jgi:threonine dehydratase